MNVGLWILITLLSLLPELAFNAEIADPESTAPKASESSEGKFHILPIDSCVTSRYGSRTKAGRPDFHSGADFRARTPIPIKSIGDGEVISITPTALCGHCVEIKFDNPSVFGHYCHLSVVSVKPHQLVKEGQVLGLTGMTGTRSPHLHFVLKPKAGLNGLKRPGKSFNPLQYLPTPPPCED